MDGVLRTVVGKPHFSPILRQILTPAIAFSPDGTKLASSRLTPSEVVLWGLTRPGAPPSVLPGYPSHTMLPGQSIAEGFVFTLAFSPDNKTLIAANADGSIGQWDLDNPQAPFVELPTQKGGVWSAAYSADGRWLAMGGKLDDAFAVWDLTHPLNASSTQEVADTVCQKIRRNLTLEEWHKFVGVELPYERTCPNLPIHPSLLETAAKLARDNDMAGAVALLERAVELDPELGLDPRQEAQRLAESGAR